jgi:hypothetical protein
LLQAGGSLPVWGDDPALTPAELGTPGSLQINVVWAKVPTVGAVPVAGKSVVVRLIDNRNRPFETILKRPASGASSSYVLFSNVTMGPAKVLVFAFPADDATGEVQARSAFTQEIQASTKVTKAVSLENAVASLAVSPPTGTPLKVGQKGAWKVVALDVSGTPVVVAASSWLWSVPKTDVMASVAAGDTLTVTGLKPGAAVATVTDLESKKTSSVVILVLGK